MEIILSKKQKELLETAFQEQQVLRGQAEQELMKIQKRIDDAVLLILDVSGLDVVPGIKYNDGKLYVPAAETEVIKDSKEETILKVVE